MLSQYDSAERDEAVKRNNPLFHRADFGDEDAYAELPVGAHDDDHERGYMTVNS